MSGEVLFEAQLGSEFSAPGTFVVGLGIPLFETWVAAPKTAIDPHSKLVSLAFLLL